MNIIRMLLCLMLLAGGGSLLAQDRSSVAHKHEHMEMAAPPKEELSAAHKYFTDVVLTNQNDEQMRLYTDLLKGKVVVINAFFTTCQVSCPVMAATISRIQERFADRLGKDLYLISISVDPETDTPARLKEYAERFKAKSGWYFLTGTSENVNLALYKLGQYVENKESHLNIMIVGNESTGLWKKALGLARPESVIEIVESVLNDKAKP